MIIVKVKPPLDEEDAGSLAFLVVDADAFSIQPDGSEVVFRRGGSGGSEGAGERIPGALE